MKHLKLHLLKIFYSAILLSTDKPSFIEKVQYWAKVLLASAPVVAVLERLGFWYDSNSQFFRFVLIALLINMGVGLWYHLKMKTFSWKEFFSRNILMFVNVLLVYVLLDMLRITAGDNIIGETFKVLIQVTTLLWPASKALKNIYILNQKKFPPAFIMDRLYNFEKNGNIKDLFNDKNDNDGLNNVG